MTNTQLLDDSIQSLGITKRYKGCKQLYLCVEHALADETRLLYITKSIYIPVAEECNCDYRSIERNIRTVASKVWKLHSDKLSEMAGYKLVTSPSVSELITILFTYVTRNSIDT